MVVVLVQEAATASVTRPSAARGLSEQPRNVGITQVGGHCILYSPSSGCALRPYHKVNIYSLETLVCMSKRRVYAKSVLSTDYMDIVGC